jgi:hypothetical protein
MTSRAVERFKYTALMGAVCPEVPSLSHNPDADNAVYAALPTSDYIGGLIPKEGVL